MADIIKYDMTDIWASSGDVVAPDSAKIVAGWGVEVVPRQWWNWFENRQDQNIAYMLQKGIPEWDATTEYQINKSYVQRNGIVYRATATSVNSDPMALVSWVRAFADYTVAINALGGLTPENGKVPYFTSGSTAGTFQTTAYSRGLLNVVDAEATRAYINAQELSISLTALASVAPATNLLPYYTGTNAAAGTTLTSLGRGLLAAIDAAAVRVILGLNNLDNTSDANKPVSTAQQAALDLKAPLASPALTGAPTAPTPATGNSSNQLATTAFVNAEIAADAPTKTGGGASGTWSIAISGNAATATAATTAATLTGLTTSVSELNFVDGVTSAIQTQIDTKSPSASPTFTGTPTAPTPSVGTNDTKLATTAFVQANAAIKDSDTGSVQISAGTTAQRTAAPTYGRLRANSTLNSLEWWDGVVWAPVVSAAQLGSRNKIINGKMEVAQRGIGAVQVTPGGYIFPVDRFFAYTNAAQTFAAQYVVSPEWWLSKLSFPRAVALSFSASSALAATTDTSFTQNIEGFNVSDLMYGTTAAKTCTFSFYIRSSVTGTFSVGFTNQGGTRTYATTYTVLQANTWEYKTIILPGDQSGSWDISNGVGLVCKWDCGSGNNFRVATNNTWGSRAGGYSASDSIYGCLAVGATTFAQAGAVVHITGVQLEVGPVASPFEHRPFEQELSLCQRYFEVITGVVIQTPGIYKNFYFKVTKRAVPTLSNINFHGGTGANFVVATDGMYQDGLHNVTSSFSAFASAEI